MFAAQMGWSDHTVHGGSGGLPARVARREVESVNPRVPRMPGGELPPAPVLAPDCARAARVER